MKYEKTRQAYLTLLQAIKDKPLSKAQTSQKQIAQVNDDAHWTRKLQDIGCYLGVVS